MYVCKIAKEEKKKEVNESDRIHCNMIVMLVRNGRTLLFAWPSSLHSPLALSSELQLSSALSDDLGRVGCHLLSRDGKRS